MRYNDTRAWHCLIFLRLKPDAAINLALSLFSSESPARWCLLLFLSHAHHHTFTFVWPGLQSWIIGKPKWGEEISQNRNLFPDLIPHPEKRCGSRLTLHSAAEYLTEFPLSHLSCPRFHEIRRPQCSAKLCIYPIYIFYMYVAFPPPGHSYRGNLDIVSSY